MLSISHRRQDFRWTCRHYGEGLPVVLRDRELTPEESREWCWGQQSGLHATSMGGAGPLVAFCHGLFGQGKNWTTA